jgi:hypothetical protein
LRRVSLDIFDGSFAVGASANFCFTALDVNGNPLQNLDLNFSDVGFSNIPVSFTVSNIRAIEFDNFYVHGFKCSRGMAQRTDSTEDSNFSIYITFEWAEEITEFVQ